MGRPIRDRVVSALPARGPLQLHILDRKTEYTCCRCGWHGVAKAIAVMDADWRKLVCRNCYDGLVKRLPPADG